MSQIDACVPQSHWIAATRRPVLRNANIVTLAPAENPVFHPTLEWDGRIWISDFKQRDFWSGPSYRIKSAEVLHRVDDKRFPRNITDEYAPIIMLQHQACVIIDHEGPYRLADDDFTEEYSRDIQQRLMIDYANRLVAAYGGKDKLRIELLNQYVDVTTLPEALRYALRTLRLTK